MRFVREIYDRCRRQVGDHYPILIKINAYDNMKNGLKFSEGVLMTEMMAEMGFDGIEVSCGIMEEGNVMARGEFPLEVFLEEWAVYKRQGPFFRFVMRHFGQKIIKPLPFVQAYNRESARVIKSKVNVPVFVVGGIIEPRIMEEIIEKGEADYISLCRALIADPKFPERIRNGSRDPSRCIHCNLCLAYACTETLRCYYGKRLGRE